VGVIRSSSPGEAKEAVRIKMAHPIVDGLYLGIGFILASIIVGIVVAVIGLALMGY
jgi:Na+-translocating ferredoxin:NAD+ oxidoreductase RnfE subunit